jgi:hypothetical protein
MPLDQHPSETQSYFGEQSGQTSSQVYFAAKEPSACAAVMMNKIDAWTNNLEANGYLDKLRASWAAYHGAYYTDVGTGHQITFGGTAGEVTNLPVNHLRNLAQHILVMTCSTRPSMEARATNTDYKSLTQTILANGLLDYYMREKRLEKILKLAVEYAIVMGSGFIKMSWNATSGQMYDFNEETQTPIYEGDVEFTVHNPLDIIEDNTKENGAMDWITVRGWKNRFDLSAKYPELKDKILSVMTKNELERFRFNGIGANDTDDVPIYEFYHKRTECLPDGRYILFLSDTIILYDGPLPYRNLPVYRIAPSDILGTPYGYSNIFDCLPLQEAINSLYSMIMSNQNAFGIQNIIVPRGADVSISELTGGLNIIECNMQAGKPEPLQLCATPQEVFKFTDMIRSEMETLSGVNSVARGNPEASLKSGTALALVQSMALQFMSGLQQSYVELIEDVGSALINMLRDFAVVPRVAAIVGKNNRSYMKEFKGDDLENVNRVIVDMGNALSRSTAGRVQMAEQLLQMGAIKNPEQYFTIINTGSLDTMIEGTQSELMLIRGENESMMDGQSVAVLAIDEHKTHIEEHRSILADPDLRRDPKLVALVLGHIQDHIKALQTTDPNLLQLLGQTPLAPPAGTTPPQGTPSNGSSAPPLSNAVKQQLQPPQNGAPQGPPGPPPPGSPPQGPQQPGMPKMPTPPAPFQHLPVQANQVPLR